MTLRPAELCGEKSLDQFPGQRVTDNLPSKANHVQIVVLDPLVRREVFVNQTRPHPPTLFAQTDAPTPLPQMATPRSTSPQATARAKGTIKSG